MGITREKDNEKMLGEGRSGRDEKEDVYDRRTDRIS